ncbi:D-alanyl-D-alanine carboxypeptidase family protein [Enterovirga sp.]|uniref:D-alanyl-D-alanine carboxypeptidase family protein n=1 Tax=Enterovirga sp. TaxID=2026350 RepID=UPI002BBA75CB|nr:D-alanyl-D-alanine carboxypeptidase family protein [Enterovirga sp.]HMO29069.1 D-alanyl-D-alanine carboxypeptidase family protein [Enterovirga sp.]
MTARPRALFATVLALAAASCGIARAQTPTLVVDAGSGRVLQAENATDPWYPASITKLMTTYVALDMVRRGQVRMDSLLTMSERAASMPPSKLGLRPGLTLTLDNALKIIMVKSANDVATMIGENLGGSVEGFAGLMNQASRRLGMRESRWYNPSGLPDPRQQTSARDMAILARALLGEFPEHQDLFHIGAVQLGRVVMRNHNGLIGRYPGADGMKTGFICAGGFNVVSTATRGGRRLITVLMGYPSARERDLKAADLFDANFNSSGWGAQTLDSLPLSAQMSPRDMRAYVCGPKRRQPAEEDDGQASAFNAENPITSLFSSATMGSSFGGVSPSGRRTLGPRVAFAPIPVWIGAQPGGNDDQLMVRGRGRVRVARERRGPAVRAASKASAPTPAAVAFTSTSTPQIMAGKKIDPVKSAKGAPRAVAAKAKPAVAGTNPGAKTAAKPVAKKSASAKE